MGDSSVLSSTAWRDRVDRVVYILPLPIVVALGLALHGIKFAAVIAYAVITFYELWEAFYVFSKSGFAFTAIRNCRHLYRGIVAAVFCITQFSSALFEINELIRFCIRVVSAVAVEIGMRFPKQRVALADIRYRVKSCQLLKDLRAALEIGTMVVLIVLAVDKGGIKTMAAAFVYFVCVVMRGIACDVHHEVIYRLIAGLLPRVLARSHVGRFVEWVFNAVVWISELIWPIERPPDAHD
jgi:hypothetical protein